MQELIKSKQFENITKPQVGEGINEKKKTNFFGGIKLRETLTRIKDAFRGTIISADEKKKKELAAKLSAELQSLEKEATREGVDFSKCQFSDLFEAGLPVEFECFSPYLSDYNLATGEIWEDKLTNTDEIGLGLAKMLRQKFSDARMICLYDEYNTEMPDATDEYGRPSRQARNSSGELVKDTKGNMKDAPQIQLSDEIKQTFKLNIEKLLPDKNKLLISESEKIKDAEVLVEKLDQAGFIKKDGQAIYFINQNAENPLFSEITLRAPNGHWMCEALDSSSYIKPENLNINHLVILPNHFKVQQDKVWEILRCLGVKSNHYHNIFYDEKSDPETVTRVIREEIEKYQLNLKKVNEK